MAGILAAGLLSTGAAAASGDIAVALEDGAVSLSARGAGLPAILAEVASRAGFVLVVSDEGVAWRGLDVGLSRRALPDLLRELTRDHLTVMRYDLGERGEPRLAELRLYPGAAGYGPRIRGPAREHADGPAGGPAGEDEVRQLERALGDRDPQVRREVVQALGWMGGERAIDVLGDVAILDPDPGTRSAAVGALAALRGGAALVLLELAAEDPDPEVRRRAREALVAPR